MMHHLSEEKNSEKSDHASLIARILQFKHETLILQLSINKDETLHTVHVYVKHSNKNHQI